MPSFWSSCKNMDSLLNDQDNPNRTREAEKDSTQLCRTINETIFSQNLILDLKAIHKLGLFFVKKKKKISQMNDHRTGGAWGKLPKLTASFAALVASLGLVEIESAKASDSFSSSSWPPSTTLQIQSTSSWINAGVQFWMNHFRGFIFSPSQLYVNLQRTWILSPIHTLAER